MSKKSDKNSLGKKQKESFINAKDTKTIFYVLLAIVVITILTFWNSQQGFQSLELLNGTEDTPELATTIFDAAGKLIGPKSFWTVMKHMQTNNPSLADSFDYLWHSLRSIGILLNLLHELRLQKQNYIDELSRCSPHHAA